MRRKLFEYYFKTALTVLVLILAVSASAQQITIKGTVTAFEDDSSIPGVNIIVQGSTQGTISDFNGNFSITASVGDILLISSMGYLNEQIIVTAGSTTLNISLVPDLIGMEEVVVIGYGTQKKSDLTGAVVSVSNEELNRKPVATIEQALQGLAAGVSVTSNSGSPGDGASVRIRGIGSINGSNPLYVIDGVPVGGPGSTNPADIESVNILKDAASCAIYGARGANGVIIITTKKGKKGIHLDFDSQFGFQKEWKRMDLLNSQQYSEYVNEIHYNKYITDNRRFAPPKIAADPYNQEYDTDWQDEMFQVAPMHRYNLSVSGGNNIANFNIFRRLFQSKRHND